ncbi:MAG: GTPase Era [Candidatus Promineifilaceae bacterium]
MSATTTLLPEEQLPENHKSGFVAVVGAPNAGKSTLVNALLKQKIAIVSPRPQTTRTRQLGIITEETHQIIFVDTPGLIKKAMHMLDNIMIDTVIESMDGADMVLWMVDGTQRPTASDRELSRLLKPLSKRMPVILAINKIDLMTMEQVATHHIAYRDLLPDAGWLVFSAETGAGLPELYQMIIDGLPEGPRFYPKDQITDAFTRTIAAEMVREQILLQMHEEIPHTVAVEVTEFKERKNGVIYIHAVVYVERDSHKRIIIGKNGQQIRSLGAKARPQIETLVDNKVFLELRVKVAPKWRRNRKMIEKFGYSQG